MKPAYIRDLGSHHIPGTPVFEKEVLFEKHITQEQIRGIGKNIANEIARIRDKRLQPSLQEHIILSLLSPKRMLDFVDVHIIQGNEEFQSLTEDELKEFLKKIQAAVVEEIKKHLDLNDPLFHFVSHTHPEKGSITYLHGDVHKNSRYKWSVENREAIAALYAANERSPYILYGLFYKDPNSGDEIQAYHDIETLKAYLYRVLTHNSNFNPLPIFTAIRDAVRAVIFLSNHGLSISDLSADNIGIDKKGAHGYLFDFDGLVPKGTPLSTYLAKQDRDSQYNAIYCPPEFFQGNALAQDGFSVYELGATLEDILPNMRHSSLVQSNQDLVSVISSFETVIWGMREKNPDQRISLDAVEKALTDLCQKITDILTKTASHP